VARQPWISTECLPLLNEQLYCLPYVHGRLSSPSKLVCLLHLAKWKPWGAMCAPCTAVGEVAFDLHLHLSTPMRVCSILYCTSCYMFVHSRNAVNAHIVHPASLPPELNVLRRLIPLHRLLEALAVQDLIDLGHHRALAPPALVVRLDGLTRARRRL
jgi:hypothetical protein